MQFLILRAVETRRYQISADEAQTGSVTSGNQRHSSPQSSSNCKHIACQQRRICTNCRRAGPRRSAHHHHQSRNHRGEHWQAGRLRIQTVTLQSRTRYPVSFRGFRWTQALTKSATELESNKHDSTSPIPTSPAHSDVLLSPLVSHNNLGWS